MTLDRIYRQLLLSNVIILSALVILLYEVGGAKLVFTGAAMFILAALTSFIASGGA